MSAPIPGEFGCAELQTIDLTAAQVFRPNGGANISTAYLPESAAALQALTLPNKPFFEPLQDPAKDRTIRIRWVDSCPQEVEDCPTDYCDISGTEAGALCQDYEIDQCIAYPGFSVTERMFRTSQLTFDQVLAPQYNQAILQVENALSKAWLEFLCANAGINEDTLSPWTIEDDATYIPASGWNADMMAYLATTLRVNKLNPGVMIGTQGLMTQWMLAQAYASTPTGAAQNVLLNSFGTPAWDLWQMPGVLGQCSGFGATPKQGMFMYDPQAVALVTKSEFLEYGAEGRVVYTPNGYTRRYAVRGRNLPIDIDMIYQVECVGKDIRHTWKPFISYGTFLNPLGCNTDRTGILKFICGSPA
jgi:hypothetical protein